MNACKSAHKKSRRIASLICEAMWENRGQVVQSMRKWFASVAPAAGSPEDQGIKEQQKWGQKEREREQERERKLTTLFIKYLAWLTITK